MSRHKRCEIPPSRIDYVLSVGLQRHLELRSSDISAPKRAAASDLSRKQKAKRSSPALNDESIREAVEYLENNPGLSFVHPVYGHIDTWNTIYVTDMESLFGGFGDALHGVELREWNVSNVTTTKAMFIGASSFTSDLSKWSVYNVTDMSFMFASASSFTSDLSKWKVNNVQDMESMFADAYSFTSDLSKWDVYNVTNMSFMFSQVPLFISDLSNWKVDKVVNMEAMFFKASSFTSDLSRWSIDSLINTDSMFLNASSYNPFYGIGFLNYPSDPPNDEYIPPMPRVVREDDGKLTVYSRYADIIPEPTSLVPAGKNVIDVFQRIMDATDPYDYTVDRRDKIDTGPPGGKFDSLRVLNVFRIKQQYTTNRVLYRSRRYEIKEEMQSGFCKANFKKIQCARTDQAVKSLKATFDDDVSEKLLLHGSLPEDVFEIAARKFDDPTTEGAYGKAVYFAEDPTKADDYSGCGRYASKGHLYFPRSYQRKFAMDLNDSIGVPREKAVYYMLASRVILGCAAHIKGGPFTGMESKDITTGELVWPTSERKKFHSGIVEHGNVECEPRGPVETKPKKERNQNARFREFLVDDPYQCLPVYVIAYERVDTSAEAGYNPVRNYDDLKCPDEEPMEEENTRTFCTISSRLA